MASGKRDANKAKPKDELDQLGPPPGSDQAEPLNLDALAGVAAEIPPAAIGELAGLPEAAGGKARQARDPYSVSVEAVRAPLSEGTYLRCRAYWARHRERAEMLSPAQRLAEYLELVTFQHALEDEQRDEDERLYDWRELHMEGLRPLMQAEIDAQRAEIASEAARGARHAVLMRIAAIAPAEVLKAIREMDDSGS